MFITRIKVHGSEVLFDIVLRELVDMCDSFVCYPSEQMFVCNSGKNAGHDYTDLLRIRNVNTDNIVAKLL